MENWISICEENLNGMVFDNFDTKEVSNVSLAKIKVDTKVLNFSAKNTINIPPVAEYTIKKHRSLLTVSGQSDMKGFEAENIVRKCFQNYGPDGGIYLSGLKVLTLIGNQYRLKPFLPDAVEVYEHLKKNADIEIDGIFIHPDIGIAIIETKAVAFKYSNNVSKVDAHKMKILKPIFAKDEAQKQLYRTQQFIEELYEIMFHGPMFIPVHKVVCAPNADTRQVKVTSDIDLLDMQALGEGEGALFKEFWNEKVQRDGSKANLRKFAAVLISFKTAFGLVSNFTSNIIANTFQILNLQKSLVVSNKTEKNSNAKNRSEKLIEDNQTVFFWLNSKQLEVLDAAPCHHFLSGVPGSGKTLLIKARILKFISNVERTALIFCPTALTYQYQNFINENKLKDRVKVKSFSELSKMAIHFPHKPSRYIEFLSERVDIYCDEMDFNTLMKFNVVLLLEERTKTKAETFVVGESPEVAKNAIYDIFANLTSFSRQNLQTMMRNSKEIMYYYKKTHDPDIVPGHSVSTCDVQPPIECQNRRIALVQVVKSIRKLLEKEYKESDIVVISFSRQKTELEYILRLSKLPKKNLANDNSRLDAVTVLEPTEIKSYEWKAVIILVGYDHEHELALAVTRAIMELIIIHDLAYERTIEILKNGTDKRPPEEILMETASPRAFQKCQKHCSTYPNVFHKEYKPTDHCQDAEEYRNWCVFMTLQECGYSARLLEQLRSRVLFEQEKKFERRISKRRQRARSADTKVRDRVSSCTDLTVALSKTFANTDRIILSRSTSTPQLPANDLREFLTNSPNKKMNGSRRKKSFNKSALDPRLNRNRRIPILPTILTHFDPYSASLSPPSVDSPYPSPTLSDGIPSSNNSTVRQRSPAPTLHEEDEEVHFLTEGQRKPIKRPIFTEATAQADMVEIFNTSFDKYFISDHSNIADGISALDNSKYYSAQVPKIVAPEKLTDDQELQAELLSEIRRDRPSTSFSSGNYDSYSNKQRLQNEENIAKKSRTFSLLTNSPFRKTLYNSESDSEASSPLSDKSAGSFFPSSRASIAKSNEQIYSSTVSSNDLQDSDFDSGTQQDHQLASSLSIVEREMNPKNMEYSRKENNLSNRKDSTLSLPVTVAATNERYFPDERPVPTTSARSSSVSYSNNQTFPSTATISVHPTAPNNSIGRPTARITNIPFSNGGIYNVENSNISEELPRFLQSVAAVNGIETSPRNRGIKPRVPRKPTFTVLRSANDLRNLRISNVMKETSLPMTRETVFGTNNSKSDLKVNLSKTPTRSIFSSHSASVAGPNNHIFSPAIPSSSLQNLANTNADLMQERVLPSLPVNVAFKATDYNSAVKVNLPKNPKKSIHSTSVSGSSNHISYSTVSRTDIRNLAADVQSTNAVNTQQTQTRRSNEMRKGSDYSVSEAIFPDLSGSIKVEVRKGTVSKMKQLFDKK